MLQFRHMSDVDAKKNAHSNALKTFRREKQRIIKERTGNLIQIILEIDQQKTDTIKQQIAGTS